ncbi:MAG: ATP-binding cassette domain-containing protein [Dysgonamonadaceae bacterium]|jgi:ATPase subunit of ABC transporter with duplicated ATPase domains|nr:ATP-binding cassette domain-containing protein [Dysgonamonadaceae bacterium]
MLILQNIQYTLFNNDLLFGNVNLTLNKNEKAALIGNNGAGKSTLLRMIAGQEPFSEGKLSVLSTPCYIPQLFGQFNDYTIAQALQIDGKLRALHEILNGNATDENFALLNDDWTIEQRCSEALKHWQLDHLDLSMKLSALSDGQQAKVFLASVALHRPELLLMDEPTNHLDMEGRQLLYDFIDKFQGALLVVSHDRTLLNRLEPIHELSFDGIKTYGGNYEFYREQKQIESNALNEDVQNREKALRKAIKTEREALERQQKQNSRGKNQQKKEGTPPAMINKMKNDAEKSTARLKDVHAGKIGLLSRELSEFRSKSNSQITPAVKFGFDNSQLHKGKILVAAKGLNYRYGAGTGCESPLLWQKPLDFQIVSGERIALCGVNGSGKTTLIKLILGELEPATGTIFRADSQAVYIDQDYSLINNRLTVYEQAQSFNRSALQEHEIKIRLNRFLFPKTVWDKSCSVLSGGEKMRLALCCLTVANRSPDMLVLDEPTNNLDIRNIEILTTAVNAYEGTLIVVSHDPCFLKQILAEQKNDLIFFPNILSGLRKNTEICRLK